MKINPSNSNFPVPDGLGYNPKLWVKIVNK